MPRNAQVMSVNEDSDNESNFNSVDTDYVPLNTKKATKRNKCFPCCCMPCADYCCPCIPMWAQALLYIFIFFSAWLVVSLSIVSPFATLTANTEGKMELKTLQIQQINVQQFRANVEVNLRDLNQVVQVKIDENNAQLNLMHMNGTWVRMGTFHVKNITIETNDQNKTVWLNETITLNPQEARDFFDALGSIITMRRNNPNFQMMLNMTVPWKVHVPGWVTPIYADLNRTFEPKNSSELLPVGVSVCQRPGNPPSPQTECCIPGQAGGQCVQFPVV